MKTKVSLHIDDSVSEAQVEGVLKDLKERLGFECAPTDEEIVMLANRLAREFYAMQGYRVKSGYRFDKARHPQEKLCWDLACKAYDFIEGTDVLEALNCVSTPTRTPAGLATTPRRA